jgi:hypothetical protein
MSRQVTEHFTDTELMCKCGCGLMPRRKFIEMVEVLRTDCEFPFHTSSVARCEKHNAEIGGAKRSDHIVTDEMNQDAFIGAIDIKLHKAEYERRYTLVDLAMEHGFDVIEVCDAHIHVGRRGVSKGILIWGVSK